MEVIATVESGILHYTDDDLENGHAYHWAVVAVRDANGDGVAQPEELSGYSDLMSNWVGDNGSESTRYR